MLWHGIAFLMVMALGDTSTGAQNDLMRATDIARSMVTEWRMSDLLGAISFEGNRRNKFMDLPGGAERGAYAEDTGKVIDAEVKRIMGDAHAEAHRNLVSHRGMLEAVTRRLLDVEVMEGAELRRILDGQSAATTHDDPGHASLSPGAP